MDIPSCLWMWGTLAIVGVGIAYHLGWPLVIKVAHGLEILKTPVWFFAIFVVLFVLTYAALEMSTVEGDVYKHLYDVLRVFTFSANDFELAKLKWGESWSLLIIIWVDSIFMVTAFLSLAAERMIRSVLAIGIPNDKDNKHVIIFGLGAWGLHYAKALASSGIDVVVIEKSPSDAAVKEVVETWVGEEYNGKRIHLIDGDYLNEKILEQAQIAYANKILPLLEDDGANIDAAYSVRKYFSNNERYKNEQVILLPVDNIRLSTSLASYSRFDDHHGTVEIRFFNIMQQAAVRHLMNHSPELYADLFNQNNVHFAIYGLGDFAINLIYVIAHIGHFRTWGMNEKMLSKKVRITIYDQKLEKDAMDDLNGLFPNLSKILDVKYVSTALMNINFDDVLNMLKPVSKDHLGESKSIDSHEHIHEGKQQGITQHIFCSSNEILSVRYAIKLRKYQMRHAMKNTPIFVRTLDGKGLTHLIESNNGNEEWPDNIFPLVLLSEKLIDNGYFSEPIDEIAKVFNCLDPDKRKEKWDSLSSDFKHSSFYQAFYLAVRLRSVGYKWQKGPTENNEEWANEKHLYKHVAHLEHDRWKSERWLLGWESISKGMRTLDDIARVHHELAAKGKPKDWEARTDVYDNSAQHDMCQAKNLPKYLNEAGCSLVKINTIGLINPSVKMKKEITNEKANTFLFNLLDDKACKLVEELMDNDAVPRERFTAILPLPFEIIKGTSDKSTVDNITSLAGKVGLYLEMPLLDPFQNWKRNDSDKQTTVKLFNANMQAEKYIAASSTMLLVGVTVNKEAPKSEVRDTRFLPNPGLKAGLNDSRK